ncbi:MAG: F0F1 ATP synthase subunit epsilon [Pseudomonadota bacterium]|nr:F0F1 ATP synthase subunit epsilon [Pseudomonadota bacterium]
MNLTILLPYEIFAQQSDVLRIAVRTGAGSFGLLPRRLDCVAGLVPGILVYQSHSTTTYVAVDQGVMVKAGPDVLVSVRRAIAGTNLRDLQGTVQHRFSQIDESERDLRSAIAKMEAALIGQFAKYRHE